MTTVLLTGFEPFGGDGSNPSAEAVRLVAATWAGPAELITAILPVTFTDAAASVRGLIEEHRPDIVIATGLAGGRTAVTPERVAINLIDARIPDNAGRRPVDEQVVPGAPAAYFSTLPVKSIARDLRAAAIPSEVSFTAGTFVCNQVFYAVMHDSALREEREHDASRPAVRAGFIHVPYSSERAPTDAAALPLADIARALQIAVHTSIRSSRDAEISAGIVS